MPESMVSPGGAGRYASCSRCARIASSSSSRAWRTPARLQAMYPHAVAVPLPTHSSWLNQIEILFSIVQRKVLTPMDVADEATLSKRVLDFQDYYQETAKPFNWKFTADDLKNRLDALKDFTTT